MRRSARVQRWRLRLIASKRGAAQLRKTIFILLARSAALTLRHGVCGQVRRNAKGRQRWHRHDAAHRAPFCPFRRHFCETGQPGGWGTPNPTPDPQGGCGFYGPNGVFIRCEQRGGTCSSAARYRAAGGKRQAAGGRRQAAGGRRQAAGGRRQAAEARCLLPATQFSQFVIPGLDPGTQPPPPTAQAAERRAGWPGQARP
jgi:hypothetical protein